MMSLETIIAVNRQIAAEAAARQRKPLVPSSPDDLDYWPSLPIPNLGSYEPPGWERTDAQWFIDKTGWGAVWEPALTAEQFKSRLRDYITDHPGHGFGIVEEGPFQAMIAAFSPADDFRREREQVQTNGGSKG